MKWIALAALVTLTACGRPSATEAETPAAAVPAAPEPPKASVTDFRQPITATGTEPFWSLKINGLDFTLSRPDQPDLVGHALGASLSPGKGQWAATTTAGQTFKVTLLVSECYDGMSDRRYPMTAEIETAQGALHGCAALTADAPKDPASEGG